MTCRLIDFRYLFTGCTTALAKIAKLTYLEEARNVIRALQKVVARMEEMQRRIDRLEAENRTLKGKVEELTRGGKRQAAPFSRGEPKKP